MRRNSGDDDKNTKTMTSKMKLASYIDAKLFIYSKQSLRLQASCIFYEASALLSDKPQLKLQRRRVSKLTIHDLISCMFNVKAK